MPPIKHSRNIQRKKKMSAGNQTITAPSHKTAQRESQIRFNTQPHTNTLYGTQCPSKSMETFFLERETHCICISTHVK